MRTTSNIIAALVVSCGALVAALPVHAQDYPTRPITIVVPFPPGGATDGSARALLPKLEQTLGQPVVIDNRGGTGGVNGSGYVARAKPDGYTLLWTVGAPISVSKFMYKEIPYDPAEDFVPISMVASTILALAVHPSMPVNNMAELVAYAKAHPGEVKYATSGIGSTQHINGSLINKHAGIDMVHVPYPGGGPAVTDLVGGHVKVGFGTLTAFLPHVQSGAIRLIAIAEKKRYEGLPDVPTIAETVPGTGIPTWLGFFAPKGTPAEIIKKLNEAVGIALKDDATKQLYASLGMAVNASTPEELGEAIRAELATNEVLFPELGIEKQ